MEHINKVGVILFAIALNGCATMSDGLSKIGIGGGENSPISGSAVSGGDGKTSESTGSKELKRCASNHGRIALEEPQVNQQMMMMFSQMGVSSFSPTPLARHAIMQSGCFTVVDRGAGFAMGEQERRISGEKGASTARQTSIARWALRVEVPQPTTQTGGGAAGLLGYLPFPGAGLLGAVVGSMKFSEAQVNLTVVDLRSSEIVASVTGTGKSTDIGLGGGFLSGIGGGLGGMSSKTPEMKVVAAAFVDAINQLVPLMDKVRVATPLLETSRISVKPVPAPTTSTKKTK